MITIQKYNTAPNGKVDMELFISSPYTGNSETRTETFDNETEAQNHFWQLVYSYFNYGVEQFVEHCKSLAENYFNPNSIPFYNNESWRQNYWELLRKFNTDYFGGIVDTTDQKAKHILANQQILVDAITLYEDAGHQKAKAMVQSLVSLSKHVLKDLEKRNTVINNELKKTA